MPEIKSMDVIFKGGGGLCFGFCHGDHIGWSQASAVQNTWYNISDADIASGPLHNVTHDGNGQLTVTYAGMYLITWTASYEVDTANTHIDMGIEINDSGDGAHVEAHGEAKFANAEVHLSGVAIEDLAASDTIELSIRTIDAGTPDLAIENVHLVCVQLGGT